MVVLTGARQVGKSTLLRNEKPFCDWRYLSLDDYDVLHQARTDPQALWSGTTEVVLDEVQKAPELLPALKRVVDQGRGPRRFVLSGSANLLLMRQMSESLAGRAVYFALAPMTCGEIGQRPSPSLLPDLLAKMAPRSEGEIADLPGLLTTLLRGLMPPTLRLSTPAVCQEWWEGYVSTYLERDLRQVSQITSLADFRRLMHLLALRTGQILNQSELARDAHLTQPTAHRYVNLLETTHLLQRLPPFAASRTKRLVKSPKVHWADPGLAIYLGGYFDSESLAAARELGGFFESFVLHHLQVLADLLAPRARVYYWRTTPGKELDVVLEQGRRLLAFEIKYSETARFSDAESLRVFLNDHPQAVAGVVIYRGQQIQQLDERIFALPLGLLVG